MDLLHHGGSVTQWSANRGQSTATMGAISPIAHHRRLPNSSPQAFMSLIPSSGGVAVEIEPAIVGAGAAGVKFGILEPL